MRDQDYRATIQALIGFCTGVVLAAAIIVGIVTVAAHG